MYEGQTLSVRIPAVDAYGEQKDPNNPDGLGGEDLIFTIENDMKWIKAIKNSYIRL